MDGLPLVHLAEGLRCFVCGPDNPRGLRLRFRWLPDRVEAAWTVDATLEGWPRLLHGAGFAALHDEAAAWAMVVLTGRVGLTTHMEVRFLKPIRLADRVTVVGRPEAVGPRSGTYATEIRLGDGTVASTARTTYVYMDADGLVAFLGAPLSDRFAEWMRADPDGRRRLAEAWALAAAQATA